MKKFGAAILFVWVLCLLSVSAVSAQTGTGTTRDPQFEQGIYDRLVAINPGAVQVFKDATAALDANDLPTAKSGFQKVIQMAPPFPDALRRLSGIEYEQKNYADAEIHARQSVAADPSTLNNANLAYILTGFQDSTRLNESLSLAQEAQRKNPDDPITIMSY